MISKNTKMPRRIRWRREKGKRLRFKERSFRGVSAEPSISKAASNSTWESSGSWMGSTGLGSGSGSGTGSGMGSGLGLVGLVRTSANSRMSSWFIMA
ncbi:MAG: hypothetical protein E3J69_06520 [Anaerolineales bacterium]|nr:MAG: hypothetical protein E3J69_06520 [Anaerolineales bacterium]